MATQTIIFNKDLLSINPVYNNSIIEYYSGLMTDVTYSTVTIGTNVFKVYPIAGVFTFNFLQIVKVLSNQNNFSDSIVPNLAVKYIYDDSTLSLAVSAIIKIFNSTTSEQVIKNYKFIKSVEQLPSYKGKIASSNNIRILLPTTNHTNYYLPYFEGYPNEFSIFGLVPNDNFYFKNVTTINQSATFISNSLEAKRVFFSDGGYNEFTSNLLGLSTTTNLVEVWVNNTFKANINIKRIESKCGLYLKWFNANGGYSYWLFEHIFTDTLSTKIIDEINGKYDNLQNVNSISTITGKSGNLTYALRTTFSVLEQEYLTSILLSPSVEMYVHQTPFNQIDKNKFVAVKLSDGAFSFDNKHSNFKLNVTITLPDLFTQTL
ncbi:hypothetical protein ACNQGL_07720 [Flavobacterium sp. LB3P21]|uniref:hypothetical protein n=1 Tax=Flavobacterium sp. LB3P21 TaxID=3401719 RepID=UPI003AAB2B51